MSKGIPAVGEDMPGGVPAIMTSEGIPFDAAAMLGEDGFHSLMDTCIQNYNVSTSVTVNQCTHKAVGRQVYDLPP